MHPLALPDPSVWPAGEDEGTGQRPEVGAAWATVRALHAALRAGAGEEAFAWLSFETRLRLDHLSAGQAERALTERWLLVEGERQSFEPEHLFLVRDLQGWRVAAQAAGDPPSVSGQRVVLELEEERGGERTWRRVVVIREGSDWRVQLLQWPLERLEAP